jgi:sensor histidine kinase YesM
VNWISSRINASLLAVAYWLVWSFLHTLVLHQFGLDWKLAAKDSLISNIILGQACLLIINTLKWYQPGATNSLLLVVWIAVLAKGSVWITQLALIYFFGENAGYTTMLDNSLLIRIAIAFLSISMVALARWVYNSQQVTKKDVEKRSDAEKLLREAELAGLRQQLQPHFLFNSLNSISALVVAKPEQARTMIQQLSDFLRGTLKKDDQQLVTLKEELNHLQLYLDIEKVRFGHRLNTVIDCDPASLDKKLPSLLLQPLVENAIKFGLYDTIGDITINIQTQVKDKNLEIRITNPYDAETAKPKQGTGFGLSSVQRRLYLTFSRGDLLQTSAAKDLFTTIVKIPQ